MKKSKSIFFIFALIALLTTLSSAFANQNIKQTFANSENNVKIENLNNETIYNYIDGPNMITGSDVDFFLCDKNNDIYHFKNNELKLETNKFRNLVDMQVYNHYLYILLDNKLIKYNPDDNSCVDILTSNLTSPTSIAINEFGFFIANKDNIIFKNNQNNLIIKQNEYILNDIAHFTDIKDMYVSSDFTIGVLHSQPSGIIISEFKLDENFENIVHKKSEIIHPSSEASFSISIHNKTRLVCFDQNKLFYTNNMLDDSLPILKSNPSNIGFISGEVQKITSFCVFGNKIIICDNSNKSNCVQSFTINKGKLEFDKLLIASAGADDDRLYLPNDTCIYDKNNILILDSGNNRVILKNQKENICKKIIDTKNSSLFIESNTLGEIYILSKQNLPTKHILISVYKSLTDTNPTQIKLPEHNFCDLELSSQNKMYLLDSTKKTLYTLDNNFQLQKILELGALNINSSTKIKTNASGNLIYILADNNIYNINLNKTTPTCDTILQIENGEIIDFIVDYKNYIYCLIKDTDGLSFIKYSNDSIKVSSILLHQLENISKITLDLSSAQIFAIDNKYNKIITINISKFINPLSDFENDYSFKTTYSKNGATFAKIKKDCKSFKHPFNIEPLTNLNKNDLVIVINKETTENPNFSYILIANKEHENILAYIDKSSLDYNVEEVDLDYDEIIITATNGTYLYYYPTGEKFAQKDTCSAHFVKYGEKLQVIGLACGFTDYSGMNFYTVKLENGEIYYVKERYAQNSKDFKAEITLQADARVEKILESDIIYIYNLVDGNYIQTSHTLKNGQYIRLIDSYDNQAKYLHIKYQSNDDDKEFVDGYVLTKYVIYQDFTLLRIVGVILLVLAVILIILSINIVYTTIKKRAINKIDYDQK